MHFGSWKYASDEGFQTIPSLYAWAQELFGMGQAGVGRSFSIYLSNILILFCYSGEELGFIGALCFGLFLYSAGGGSELPQCTRLWDCWQQDT
jgi:cell division protein FtsW (lipid II flippase)